jgi:hypothetical protein
MRYLGIVTALFLSLLAGYLYLDNRRLDARVVAEVASHQQTKSDYRAAQAEAHALDVQRLLAEERKHEAVNERIRNDYQASLADLHRRAQRLYDHPQRSRRYRHRVRLARLTNGKSPIYRNGPLARRRKSCPTNTCPRS